MKRLLGFIYGIFAYAVFFMTFLYAIGFTGNFVVPKTITSGDAPSFIHALLINVILMNLFAVQHSIMARQWFKKWWTKFVPQPLERSTFVLFASLLLALLFWQWQPMPDIIWNVEHPAGILILRTLFWGGWLMVLASTFIIDHWELFGIRQVYMYFLNKPCPPPKFMVASLYKYIRHPLLLGFIIAFWSTPRMTTGQLVFAIVTTCYILIAIQFEERDLVRIHGEKYKEYRRNVSMILPTPSRKKGLADDMPHENESGKDCTIHTC